jgi:hypothetical protein
MVAAGHFEVKSTNQMAPAASIPARKAGSGATFRKSAVTMDSPTQMGPDCEVSSQDLLDSGRKRPGWHSSC